ncbi:unnamed protein product, partial [Sphenostylis stenocarpa]
MSESFPKHPIPASSIHLIHLPTYLSVSEQDASGRIFHTQEARLGTRPGCSSSAGLKAMRGRLME